MALIKIPKEMGSTPGIVDNSNATAITIGSDESVTVTGEITANGGIALGDNDRATFGASDDLQIYHDGNHSYIEDAGTGSIKIKVGDFRVENASGNNLIKGVGDVATLHHAGSEKLATTATGIDVTGTATIDGGATENTVLTLDSGTANTYLKITDSNSTNGTFIGATTNDLNFYPNNSLAVTMTAAGNVGIGVSASLQGQLNVGGDAGGDPSMYVFGSRGAADNLPAGHLTFRNVANGVGDVNLSRIQSLTGTGSNQTQKGQLAFSTNDGSSLTERMRITSSGRVGIGEQTPLGLLHLRNDGDTADLILQVGGGSGRRYAIQSRTDGSLATYDSNAGSERMRIDSSGSLLVGTTTSPQYAGMAVGSTSSGKNINVFSSANGSNGIIAVYSSDNTQQGQLYAGTGDINLFGASVVKVVASSGGVKLNTHATSWVSNSDERAKDIIEPITNAAQKVSTLRAVIGKYKTDSEETRRSFLIAQDVQAVLPEAVDATDEDNLGVRYTETIPLLVAAIQEQQATIEALTQRLTALENN